MYKIFNFFLFSPICEVYSLSLKTINRTISQIIIVHQSDTKSDNQSDTLVISTMFNPIKEFAYQDQHAYKKRILSISSEPKVSYHLSHSGHSIQNTVLISFINRT